MNIREFQIYTNWFGNYFWLSLKGCVLSLERHSSYLSGHLKRLKESLGEKYQIVVLSWIFQLFVCVHLIELL